MKCPCQFCKDKRHLNCHSDCEEYLAWKQEKADTHQKILDAKKVDADFYGARAYGISRANNMSTYGRRSS